MDQDIVNGFIEKLQKLNQEYTNKLLLSEVQMEKMSAILQQKDEEIKVLKEQLGIDESKEEFE